MPLSHTFQSSVVSGVSPVAQSSQKFGRLRWVFSGKLHWRRPASGPGTSWLKVDLPVPSAVARPVRPGRRHLVTATVATVRLTHMGAMRGDTPNALSRRVPAGPRAIRRIGARGTSQVHLQPLDGQVRAEDSSHRHETARGARANTWCNHPFALWLPNTFSSIVCTARGPHPSSTDPRDFADCGSSL